jgi:hypothetical protein
MRLRKLRQSPYLIPGRLADVLAAVQIMAAAERPERKVKDWANELDRNRENSTVERWKSVFSDHREFFLVYTLEGDNDLKAALRWRYVNKLYDSKTGKEYTPEEKEALPKEKQWSLTTKPLPADGVTALMDTAINLHNRAIEELGAARWWIPLLVIVVGGVITLIGNAYVTFTQSQYQFRLTFAQKNAELALQILQRDSNQTSPELRAWAVAVLAQTSNIPIGDKTRQELSNVPPVIPASKK